MKAIQKVLVLTALVGASAVLIPSQADAKHFTYCTVINKGRFVGQELSRKEAIRIVLHRVPGATEKNVINIERLLEDNHPVYRGAIYKDGKKYNFVIGIECGHIIDWEEEVIL
ncbi:MAG: hypothetical protein HUJ85_06255 [Veillonella sp.]|nr:hypothetical protein [Veillonella sp.]